MRLRLSGLAAVVLLTGSGPAARAAEGFSLADTAGDHLDVLLDGKVVARYMYAHDVSSKERREVTYKPYLHVFDADGKAPITKGTGGQFPHHRGIFVGWNKITFDGKSFDHWHMKPGDIVHEKFLNQAADADHAAFTSLTHWQTEKGQSVVDEERTVTVRRAKVPGRIMVDVVEKLAAPNGDVSLNGDPEHAGVQFRPAAEVSAKDTVYYFPGETADPTKDVDYPWVGETFTLAGKQHSVVILNHPDNPKKTRFSAYRDYGRFGAFPAAVVKKGEALTLRYRFVVADGAMPAADYVQQSWDEFAGAKGSPTPKVKVIPVKVAAPKTPAPKK